MSDMKVVCAHQQVHCSKQTAKVMNRLKLLAIDQTYGAVKGMSRHDCENVHGGNECPSLQRREYYAVSSHLRCLVDFPRV